MVTTEHHKLLCRIEATKLRKRGYKVEFEKPLNLCGRKHKVDVLAIKGNEILAIECGYLPELTKHDFLYNIKNGKIIKVIHVPYIRQWCRKSYPPPPLVYEQMSREDKRKAIKEMRGKLAQELKQ